MQIFDNYMIIFNRKFNKMINLKYFQNIKKMNKINQIKKIIRYSN